MSVVKDILNLRKEFGWLLKKPKLAADEIANAMELLRFIDVVQYSENLPLAYREREGFAGMNDHMRQVLVSYALMSYCQSKKIAYEMGIDDAGQIIPS